MIASSRTKSEKLEENGSGLKWGGKRKVGTGRNRKGRNGGREEDGNLSSR